MLAREKFDGLHEWHNGRTSLPDAQKGRSARPQRAKRRGVRFGTLSPLSDARTPLAGCFSVLLRATIGWRDDLFEDRTEAEIGNGIFEVGIQPLEGSHVRVGDVFHR